MPIAAEILVEECPTPKVSKGLSDLLESRQTLQLTHARHALAATGQDFVRIRLVTDIPHDAIMWRVEDVMQGDGQFDHSQPGAKVPPRPCDRIQQIVSELLGQFDELLGAKVTQRTQVRRDPVQQGSIGSGCRQILNHGEDHTPTNHARGV